MLNKSLTKDYKLRILHKPIALPTKYKYVIAYGLECPPELLGLGFSLASYYILVTILVPGL